MRKSDKPDTWTARQVIDFLGKFPQDTPVFFYIKDDAWDGISTIDPAIYNGDSVRVFDAKEEEQEAKDDEREPRKPNAVVIYGNHN